MQNRTDLLFAIGRPFGPIYSLLMKLRDKAYKAHFFKRYKLSVPVISVGNLVLGGTGKTPTVRHIADTLSRRGYSLAIVSRGYGGKARGTVNIVSDGKQVLLSPYEAGDEPFMLAELLPGIPVLTGTRRIHPCQYAINNFNVDAIILDDGFQHLSIERDIDIVLFDATTLAGNSRVFPGGILREPVSALDRCHAFLLTGITADNKTQAQRFSDLLQERFPGKPVFFSSTDDSQLWHPASEKTSDKTAKTFFAFCGIANPSRFKNSLANYGIKPCGFLTLSDHAEYDQNILSNLCQKAKNSGADNLVTTEKDFVKIKNLEVELPLHVLKISPKIDRSFDDFIIDRLDSVRKSDAT